MDENSVGSNRRGFLGFLGLGAAAGPKFVQEAIAKQSLPNMQFGTASAVFSNGEDPDTTSYFDDEEDDGYYSKKGVDGTNFSQNYIRKLSRRLEDEAEIEYIKKHGPTVEMRMIAGCFANDRVVKGHIPPNIRTLKSFSESRKSQLAYEHYFKKHLENQIEQKLYDIQKRVEREAFEKYNRLYKKTKASFLGAALKRVL